MATNDYNNAKKPTFHTCTSTPIYIRVIRRGALLQPHSRTHDFVSTTGLSTFNLRIPHDGEHAITPIIGFT